MHRTTSAQLLTSLRRHANPARAKSNLRFFKTEPGQYGAGDRFLGLTVPQVRATVKKFRDLPLSESKKLLKSPWHEARQAALYVMVHQFQQGDTVTRKRIYDTYVAHTRYINNWDLVDTTAEYTVGAYLADKSKRPLYRLAQSRNLWEKRIAMLATFHYIKQGDCRDALRIARILVHDPHDLLHKAVGWMLREIGNRCSLQAEEKFLRQHANHMPRTMLRYAIEKFPERKRLNYLYGTKNNKRPVDRGTR